MKNLIIVMGLATMLVGCEGLYAPGDISSIRSQRQVDAYNATVTAEADKLVCTKEKPLGSNIPKFYCVTAGQQERLALQAQQDLEAIRSATNGVTN